MNALLKFFFVIIVVSLPIPCDAGPVLSDEEAPGIIGAHFGYPIVVSTQITFKGKSREMLDYLKRTGYIVDSPAQSCCGDFYATAEKGKPHFGDFVKYFSHGDLYVDCVYAKKTIKSIETILLDTKKRGATVVYIESLEPDEPVYSEVFRKSREGAQEIDFNKTQRIKVKMRYDGKGWRVEGKRDGK
ncbi:MAG: hypothetical protein ACHQ0Y_12350 [Thermodesulfovibrionales bacterium]